METKEKENKLNKKKEGVSYETKITIDDYFKDWRGGYPEFDTAFDNQVGKEHL